MKKDTKYIRCKRCNRPLKTEEAQLRGYGTICYKRYLEENKLVQKDLFSMQFNKDIIK